MQRMGHSNSVQVVGVLCKATFQVDAVVLMKTLMSGSGRRMWDTVQWGLIELNFDWREFRLW